MAANWNRQISGILFSALYTKNSKLSDVEKFRYLLTQLNGDAKRAVEI